MKDEFTTAMHADMLGWSKEDTSLMSIYARILKGYDQSEACKKYGITEEFYDDNIEAALKRC